MIKKIILIGLVVVVGVLVLAALQSPTFSLSRGTVVATAPSIPFGLVNDFHRWEAWSPWAKLDPGMKVVFEGPDSGAGAVYKWSGNSAVGEGRMEILESRSNSLVRIKLDFIKPFAATNLTVFEFKPEGAGTSVNWSMSGTNGFVEKAMSLVISMDKMVGPDFEKGLAQLKTAAEAGRK